jgi:uncharacterized protein (DUF2267 family)
MKYREIIKKVQTYSGLDDQESEDALQTMVEVLAVHLPEGGRKDFAAELPEELEDIALSVWPTEVTAREDIIEQMADLQDIDQNHATTMIKAVWQALKDAISPTGIKDIRDQLPRIAKTLLT